MIYLNSTGWINLLWYSFELYIKHSELIISLKTSADSRIAWTDSCKRWF